MSESTEDVVVDNTGLFIAYAALGIGAIVPIIVGSIGSVSALGIKVKKEKVEIISMK